MEDAVCLYLDLIRSSELLVHADDLQYERFSREFERYILDELYYFELEHLGHLQGDSCILFGKPALARAFVAFAKTLAHNFQKEMASLPRLMGMKIPALRLGVCIGRHLDANKMSDAARRAQRAAGCGHENDVIIDGEVREAVAEAFPTQAIPPSKKMMEEESFPVFRVGTFNSRLADELDTDPSRNGHLHYVRYLDRTAYFLQPPQLFRKESQDLFRDYDKRCREPGTSASLANCAQLQETLRRRIYKTPDEDARVEVSDALLLRRIGDPLRHYTLLIKLSPSYEEANRWYERLIADKNIEPDTITFNTLISKAPRYGTALHWFKEIGRFGKRPSHVTHTELLHLAPDFVAAKKHFNALEELGKETVGPGKVAYTAMIALAPTYDEAKVFYDKLKASRVCTDAAVYNALIRKSPDINTAEMWFECLRKAKHRPTERTFNSLIRLSPDFTWGKKWLDEMKAQDIPRNHFVYTSLIRLSPDFETADKLFEDMPGDRCDRDIATYNALLHAGPDRDKAASIILRMRANNMPPNETTYGTLIDIAETLDDALGWITEMSCEPNAHITSSLSKKVKSRKDADRAAGVLLKLGTHFKEPDYRLIYQAVAHESAAREFLKWSEAAPHHKWYQSLDGAVVAYMKQDRIDYACYVAALIPHLQASATLFRRCPDFSERYYAALVADGFNLKDNVCALACCYFENDRLSEALTLYQRALTFSAHHKRISFIRARIAAIQDNRNAPHH